MIRLACVLILPLMILLSGPVQADERILLNRSDIQVHENGELTITETIRVRSEGNKIRRGIYRDFPTRYRDKLRNYVNVSFDVQSVLRNGSPEAWHTAELSNGVRVYAGHKNRQIQPGVHDYQITYVTNRQLGFFEDHDELYFNAIGLGWEFPIDRAEVTVTLPFRISADQLTLDSYSGAYGLKTSNATSSQTRENKVLFETTRSLAPREGLTIAVGWPKGLIEEPGPRQKLGWFMSDNGAAVILLAGWLIALAYYWRVWNKVGRDPRKGIIIPRFEPPAGLSAAATRFVKDMSFDRHAFTASIISLAVKNQLIIEEDDKEFSLKRVAKAPAASLTEGEKGVLNTLLPSRSSRIEMKNENHSEFQAARQALKKALKKEYQGQLFHLNGKYVFPAVLASGAAAAIAAFFDAGPAVWISYAVATVLLHILFIFLMRAPTPGGRLVMDEIEGFKMYLDTAEQDRLDRMRSPALTPEVFETFLPYAYALGVENNWCQRFARVMPQEVQKQSGYNPGWYRGNFNGMRALNHLGDNFSSSFSSAISSASTPPGSSSGSGGGGSSGGGGGGGGGGGW